MRRALPVPFLDLLFILLLAMLVLMIPKQPIRTTDIENPAEFLIELQWDDQSCSDIDLWFRTPSGAKVWFSSKQAGVYSLDRDDLGCMNDTVTDPDGTRRVVRINREVLTMRGWEAGRYVVNVHAYTFKDAAPINVTVRMVRLNPFKEEWTRQVQIEMQGQETTISSFALDAQGNIGGIETSFVRLTR